MVTQALEDLRTNKVPLSKLELSKELRRKPYKNPQVHSEVARKVAERDPSRAYHAGNEHNANHAGDRVPYLIVDQGISKSTKKVEVSQKAEDPQYVQEKGLKPDLLFYITNQLKNPISSILELRGLGCEPESLFKEPIRLQNNAQQGMRRDLTHWFKPK